MPEAEGLGKRTRFAFGIGAAAESGLTIAFNTFNFLFYNNVLGLSGTLCGLAVTIALVFDAISDPLVGSLSDRWRSRLGRRHPFLYAAPIPMGIFFVSIYSPPEGLGGFPLFLWFTTCTVLLRTAQTFYHVPHLALGAELSDDYRERSVLMTYNSFFGMFGRAVILFLGWTYFGSLEGGATQRTGYPVMATAIAVYAALIIFTSAFFTRDQIPRLSSPPAELPRFDLGGLFREVRGCFGNRNYLLLVLGMFFLAATLGIRETLSAYMNLFFWELEEHQIRYFALGAPPGLLLAFFLTARLHVWLTKRTTLILAVAGTSLCLAGPITLRLLGWFPENNSEWLLPTLVTWIVGGFCFGTMVQITTDSALADVVDEHELLSGRRQEGVFYSARTFFGKLTSGLGHVVAGIAIDLIHFPVGAEPGSIDPTILFRLGVVAGPLTVIPALISVLFYAGYRIDKHRHAEIRSELDRRLAAASSGPESREG